MRTMHDAKDAPIPFDDPEQGPSVILLRRIRDKIAITISFRNGGDIEAVLDAETAAAVRDGLSRRIAELERDA